ncbi:MAG: aminodeoxychorismate/anthranilate synthase component II [Alphaproteobacteria bacterium]|nr:aminodeoxychorismate/anthranilate synthase component II [Alphaproteobacteria bacterium]
MILLIDNYDSFVHNLARYFAVAGHAVRVVRNDAMTAQDILQINPAAVVLSPGPCAPAQAGISNAVIRLSAGRVPILGVCLGHQCIGEVYGGTVTRAPVPMHGKASAIRHEGQGLFAGLPQDFSAGRYHSLRVELPQESDLCVDAVDDAGVIMALRHKAHSVFGVQFHPESILTPHGVHIVQNFLKTVKT